jgi:hypothetical protein
MRIGSVKSRRLSKLTGLIAANRPLAFELIEWQKTDDLQPD